MPSDGGLGAGNDSGTPLSAAQIALLQAVPSGAAALAGIAVFLLLLAWILIYLTIYVPRGMVG